MRREGHLEEEVRRFDWKEWAPVIGIYFAPRNIARGEQSLSLRGREPINGAYHAFVSLGPTIYAIIRIADI